MDTDAENIGEKLADLRKQSNMSQEQLADKLNISRQAVSNWERNKSQPDIPAILKICGLFGVGVDELIIRRTMSASFKREDEEKFSDDYVIRGDKKMSKQNEKSVSKYDMAIGLFYAVGLFLGIGFFFVVGLVWNEPMVWGASLFGGVCLFLVTGLLSHGLITLFRKDK